MTHPADLLPDFDHITNHAFKRSLGPLARREPSTLGIYEADHACLLRTDLPGFKNSKVSLKFEEGVLRVRAEGILEITHPKLETGNAGGLSIEMQLEILQLPIIHEQTISSQSVALWGCRQRGHDHSLYPAR